MVKIKCQVCKKGKDMSLQDIWCTFSRKTTQDRQRMKDAEKARKVEVESRKEKEKGRQEHEKGDCCGNSKYNHHLVNYSICGYKKYIKGY